MRLQARYLLTIILLLCLGACSSAFGGPVSVMVPQPAPPAAVDFRDEIIYFAFTDRFANGDTTNDDGDLSRAGDAWDPTNPIGWHGGDFEGIRQKIVVRYFQDMGFAAIWISPVLLLVPCPGMGCRRLTFPVATHSDSAFAEP